MLTASPDASAAVVPVSRRARLATLSVAALGVVYGDIGTSPLYALKEVFAGTHHPVPVDTASVLGILSLVFWSLMIIVSIKYIVFIMRADNKGEGGIMALMALVISSEKNPRRARVLMLMGLFGAALFYGDGTITPAISVLSAVEGLEVATPAFKPYVIPITLAVLVVLFAVQKRGTGSVGALFGPIMMLWFVTLAAFGVLGIARAPAVLFALNPFYAVQFLAGHPTLGFFALGGVVLAVTGAEALYADMGHFGALPVRLAWSSLVLPALTLNYFGQGALLLVDAKAVENPFYLLAPAWALYPLVALSTVATIIASQAVISGAFSITQQAMQLGYAPRMELEHTSHHQIGQIYVPAINRALFLGVVALVLGFGSSTNLAAAYGIAVTGTMAITTILAFVVARRMWNWSLPASVALFGAFLLVDVSFFCANLVKIVEGGWFPLAFAGCVFLFMSTWKRGRELLSDRLEADSIPARCLCRKRVARLREGSRPRDLHDGESGNRAACAAAQHEALQEPARARAAAQRDDARHPARAADAAPRRRADQLAVLAGADLLRLHGRAESSRGARMERGTGAAGRPDGHVVLPRPRNAAPAARCRNGAVAREAVRDDVPQLRWCRRLLPAAAEPGRGTRVADRALTSAGRARRLEPVDRRTALPAPAFRRIESDASHRGAQRPKEH